MNEANVQKRSEIGDFVTRHKDTNFLLFSPLFNPPEEKGVIDFVFVIRF